MTTVEVEPLLEDMDGNPELCDPDQAKLWGVYTRTPDPDGDCLAVWVSDHRSEFSAELAAARLRLVLGVAP